MEIIQIYHHLLDVKFVLLYVIHRYIAVTHAHTFTFRHTHQQMTAVRSDQDIVRTWSTV